MNARTLDELLHHWGAVIGRAEKGFPRDFALSIQKARKRAGWQPSPKQLALMHRMVADLFLHQDHGDGELIERVG